MLQLRHQFWNANFRTFKLFIILCLITLMNAHSVQAVSLHSSQHFFQNNNGTPFFYLADTAWELFHRLNREDADYYLTTRDNQGYNTIQAVIVAEIDGVTVGNAYGDKVFTNNNPATPNNAYFNHVDYIVNKANSLGLTMAILPAWGSWIDDGTLTSFNGEAFGRYLGQRYRGKNIIWVMGGDRNPDTDAKKNAWRAIARGIAKGWSTNGTEDYSAVIMSFHPRGNQNSYTWFPNEPWMDFHMLQSGHGSLNLDNYTKTLSNWNLATPKPTLDAEPNYEDHPINFSAANGFFRDWDVRKAAYWSVFAGSAGHTYGHAAIWQMCIASIPCRSSVSSSGVPDWKTALNRPGGKQMLYVRKLIESRPFFTRIPDNSVVTRAIGSGADHKGATRDSSGSYAMVYSPSGNAFTVNMAQINGPVKAYWFNPRDGSASVIGEFANSGSRDFSPPTKGNGNDWVLVLDNKNMGFGTPGGVSVPTSPLPSPSSVPTPSPSPSPSPKPTTSPFPSPQPTPSPNPSPSVSPSPNPTDITFFRAINFNGAALAIDGQNWESKDAPNYTFTGSSFANQAITLNPSTDAARATMIRSSIWNRNGTNVELQNVPAGTYRVSLYVWEDNNSATFDLSLEGSKVQSGIVTGAAGSWQKLGPYEVTVNDGTLSLLASPAEVNFSGIEIWRNNPGETECSKADIYSDGVVNLADYSILVANFLKTVLSNPRADINGDGNVNLADYSILIRYIFKSC